MPKQADALTPSAVANAKAKAAPYKLPDGRGLFLLVTPDGAKLWRWRYRRPGTGTENMLSLGMYPDVPLRKARDRRNEARALLADGIDPGVHRLARKAADKAAAANSYEAVAREWLARMAAHEWVPAQTAKETRNQEKHVFPSIGAKPIADIAVSDLSPIVLRLADGGHHELAHRLRANLSRIFIYAAATERIPTGANPAAPLKQLLPSRRPARRMPTITDPARIGELLRAMDGHTGTFVVGAAMKLSILFGCRPGELRQSAWASVNLEGDTPTLTCPPSIRKLRRAQKESPDTLPHIIPLSAQAVAILRELHTHTGRGALIFPGARDRNRPMSEAAVTAALRNIGFGAEIVAHGFRHMVSTRLREMGYRREVVEAQLSHKVQGVEGVYNMAQYLPERRTMMQAWASYLDSLRSSTNVVSLRMTA